MWSVAMAMSGCWGGTTGRVLEVDVIEEDVASVVEPSTGRHFTVHTRALPAGAHEGDVIVDGRLDPGLAAAERAERARIREAHAVTVRGELDLSEPAPDRSLTPSTEP